VRDAQFDLDQPDGKVHVPKKLHQVASDRNMIKDAGIVAHSDERRRPAGNLRPVAVRLDAKLKKKSWCTIKKVRASGETIPAPPWAWWTSLQVKALIIPPLVIPTIWLAVLDGQVPALGNRIGGKLGREDLSERGYGRCADQQAGRCEMYALASHPEPPT